MISRTTGIALAIFLTACGSQYDRALSWLEWVARWNQIGSSPDFWLVKRSFGVDDRVALVFGYMSDFDGCMDIAQMLSDRYPGTNYTCRPAN